ncbi:hypothetical protein J2X97_003393 [Epilithonimonas hungarica]|uniref:hypothetical protein n=1 Tax=Epilithonimonas hungarica TaxID=454006 RepID=UPI002786E424|nr:hypothetical protein [Epilithonimonas hungarica]MDP9957721.1 hypothetical protein [Epilithonimonas hungarica]
MLVASVFIFSCKDDDDDYVQVDVDYPAVYDLNINLIQNAPNYYGYNQPFDRPMLSQDIVLVYRKNNPGSNTPIWEPLPKTYFFDANAMDYTFNFTTSDVQIDLSADFDLSVQNASFKSTYLNGQTFRIVLVPAVYGNKNANTVDLSKMTYEEVIAKYKINDSKVRTL